jgi:hypothetical protein
LRPFAFRFRCCAPDVNPERLRPFSDR